MFANLIIKNDSRIDSVSDKQDQSVEVLPLTTDELGCVGGGHGIVNIG